MAGVFQGEDEWNKEAQEGEAVAVMCEPCKSEVGGNITSSTSNISPGSLFCSSS